MFASFQRGIGKLITPDARLATKEEWVNSLDLQFDPMFQTTLKAEKTVEDWKNQVENWLQHISSMLESTSVLSDVTQLSSSIPTDLMMNAYETNKKSHLAIAQNFQPMKQKIQENVVAKANDLLVRFSQIKKQNFAREEQRSDFVYRLNKLVGLRKALDRTYASNASAATRNRSLIGDDDHFIAELRRKHTRTKDEEQYVRNVDKTTDAQQAFIKIHDLASSQVSASNHSLRHELELFVTNFYRIEYLLISQWHTQLEESAQGFENLTQRTSQPVDVVLPPSNPQ